MELTIPEQDFNVIMSAVGYPVITIDELSNKAMTRKDIEDNLIYPAMEEYYRYFPLENTQECYISGDYSIPFPDDETIGVVDARNVLRTFGGQGSPNSPFLLELMVSRARGTTYGTRNDYDFFQAKQFNRLETQGVLESVRTSKYKVNYEDRTLEGFTTVAGRLKVTWGKIGYDFSKIPFKHKRDVIRLSQAYILQFFGSILQQAAAQVPVDVSGDSFVERAEKLRDEVITRWKEFSKVVIIRG